MQEKTEVKARKNIEIVNTEEGGRRPWQYVKIKIPTYQWEMEDGEHGNKLKPDTMPPERRATKLVVQRCQRGEKNRIRIDFPLHLWGKVGHWWERPKWGDRKPGLLKGVTWLELVADF